MRAALFALLRSIILPVEVLAAALLYMRPLRHRSRYILRIALCVPALIFAFELGMLCLPGLPTFGITLMYCFGSYLLAAALALCGCDVTLPEALYCATCAYLTQHVAYCLNRLLTPGIVEGDLGSYSPLYFLIYGAAYGGAYLFVARRIASEGGYRTRLGQSLRLTLSALGVALVLSAVGQWLQAQSQALYSVCLLYGVACCFFVLWGQLSQQRQLALQHELDVQQQLWLKHKAQYEMSAENVELINRKCHDLKHQIAALRQISDQSQRERSIGELERSVMIYDAMVETGNDILDTVLTEKSLACEARGITLTCVADGACLAFMDAVDIYTIFGNALDNAIESAGALADEDKRLISVTVFERSELVLIQMENYCAGPLNFEGDLPATSKSAEPGWHGYGLRSIRYTAEKYGGLLSVRSEGDVFQLQVSIPRYGGT